jgi:O-methyltransferase
MASPPRKVVYSSKHAAEIVDPDLPDIDRDVLFAEIFAAARQYTMTPKVRMFALYEACKHVVVAGIAGDFVECGVWRGGSSIVAALTFERLAGRRHGRRIHLFDTFEGMAPPTEIDVDVSGTRAETYIAQFGDGGKWVYCDEAEVARNFEAAGVRHSELVFVRGRVEETIPARAPRRISVLRLDTDWYESTLHEFEHLWPRLVSDGMCIVDDYGFWAGSRAATDEYFAKRGEHVLLHRIDGEARLIVKRRDRHRLLSWPGRRGSP